MHVEFTAINPQTGETGSTYIDVSKIVQWNELTYDSDTPQGFHRSMRNRSVTMVIVANGVPVFVTENFHQASLKILKPQAVTSERLQEHEKMASELRAKLSPIAV